MISKCRNVEAAISAIKSMAKAWQKHGSRTFFRNVETESEEIPKSCQPRTYNVKHVFEQLLQEVYNQVQIRQIFNDQNIIREWFTCVTCDRNSCDFKLFYGLTWFDMVKSHTWRCLAVQQSFGTWMNIENAGFMNGKNCRKRVPFDTEETMRKLCPTICHENLLGVLRRQRTPKSGAENQVASRSSVKLIFRPYD